MNINIKEIFRSDLDPNSTTWWSKDKIDKLNFNFYQFINGGMPGPAGFKGPDGDYGNIGPRGFQGYSGAQGYQGAQGASAPSDWLEIPEKTKEGITYPAVLFPQVPPSPPYIEYTPIVIKNGYLNPNNETPEDYRGAVKTVYIDSLNGGSQNKIGLRIQHDGKAADFRLKRTGNFLDMEIGRIVTADAGFDLLNISDEVVYEILGENYIKIVENLITLGGNINTTINTKKFISKSAIQISQGAIQGYVLLSEGINGKVKWVDKKSVFGSFPIGSIMSIRAEDFNSTNFELNTTITQAGPPYRELRLIYGRGKENTDFDGWYLCNGEKWKVENGINEFQTPNLCSFNYEINTNGNGQNLVIAGNNTPVIIGGSNISMNAATSGGGNYQITLSADNSDDTINMGTSSLNTEVSRMVHIVYLENATLHWSNTEYTPPPPVSTNITLTIGSTSSDIACTRIPNVIFSWSGINENEWGTFDHNVTQHYLYIVNTTNFAQAGWYKNTTGITRYWNGSAFTQSTQCVSLPVNTASLVTNANALLLNGPISQFAGADYEINATDFRTCTSVYIMQTGEYANPGWYRDMSTGVRRYWNGNTFIGNTFIQDYIHQINKSSYNTSQYLQGCSLVSSTRQTYVETSLSNLIGFELYDFQFYEFVLYVHNGWISGAAGTVPLVNVISQNAPNSTSRYRTLYKINTTGIFEGDIIIDKEYGDIDQSTGIIVDAGFC